METDVSGEAAGAGVDDSTINSRNSELDTPLHTASARGSLVIVRYLLQGGGDPSIENDRNQNSLMVAAEFGHISVLWYLWACTKDEHINWAQQNRIGDNILQLAARNGHYHCVRFLLTSCISYGNLESIRDNVNKEQMDASALAYRHGYQGIVELLASWGGRFYNPKHVERAEPQDEISKENKRSRHASPKRASSLESPASAQQPHILCRDGDITPSYASVLRIKRQGRKGQGKVFHEDLSITECTRVLDRQIKRALDKGRRIWEQRKKFQFRVARIRCSYNSVADCHRDIVRRVSQDYARIRRVEEILALSQSRLISLNRAADADFARRRNGDLDQAVLDHVRLAWVKEVLHLDRREHHCNCYKSYFDRPPTMPEYRHACAT